MRFPGWAGPQCPKRRPATLLAGATQQAPPHDLRHRRISLLHLRGTPWARIGEHVGQRSLRVTADTYSHVLVDGERCDFDYQVAFTVVIHDTVFDDLDNPTG